VTRQHALLLNADYTPYKVITWRRAVELLLDDRADLVEGYVDQFVRSVTIAVPWPAVLRLRQFVKAKLRVRFNRQNVLARDDYTCAYCGVAPRKRDGRPRLEALSIDHVVPRAQARNGKVRAHASTGLDGRIPVTCWENVVSACLDCNLAKADRTPEQAGLPLRITPKMPTVLDVLRMNLRRVVVPDEWKEWLPAGAEAWSGYWTDELEDA
jgi:5-methylcytosine-specific restriction endonuclease McrA